jgi:hypothetical protein
MSNMSNRAGKGSAPRPIQDRETFGNNFDQIFRKNREDVAVKEASPEPENTNNEYSLEELIASVPVDLYQNHAWVRDVCYQANLILIAANRVVKTSNRIRPPR